MRGSFVELHTNYFAVNNMPNSRMEQWRVDFKPDSDNMFLKKRLVNSLMTELGHFVFDGTLLYTFYKLAGGDDPRVNRVVTDPESNQQYTIVMKLVGEVHSDETRYLLVLNIILRKCMEHLKLAKVGREFYDPLGEVALKQWKLQLWPGYTTSIRQHETKILLNCDTKFKIIREDNALHVLKEARGNKLQAEANLIGKIVMTVYNNKTYRIEGVKWTDTPNSTFESKGKSESFASYYKRRYDAKIQETGQPLLSAKPRERDFRRNPDQGEHYVVLVPELCRMTGLKDDQRANFRLMSDIAEYTRTAPGAKVKALKQFCDRFNNPKVLAEMKAWNLEFSSRMEQFKGRVLDGQPIIQGGGSQFKYKADNPDWGASFRNAKLYQTATCSKWAIVYHDRDAGSTKNFIKLLVKSSQTMGFQLAANPFEVPLKDNKANTYGKEVDALCKKQPNMIVVVVPNNKGDAYSVVKKICCGEQGIPSQVVTGTVLGKEKIIASVAVKIAIQMATKLGAEPWKLNLPTKTLMIVGYDTFHDTVNKKKSVGALISTTNPDLTRYFSTVCIHESNDELQVSMKQAFTRALEAYQRNNAGAVPERIIVYRDGVSEGQVRYVKETEICNIRAVFKNLKIEPKLAFIIVNKRINTRFYARKGADFGNPPAGTVIDNTVTLPERYDFFVIPQNVRQGTVNPTSYNVIEDTTGLKPDQMQLLTYSLCHLYFNWPGTVKVPAVCQYAHKLANLIGQSVHRQPSDRLSDLLYYL